MHDGCYNIEVHKVMMMGEIEASTCDAFIWIAQDDPDGDQVCYNTVTHAVSTDATNETQCAGYSLNTIRTTMQLR